MKTNGGKAVPQQSWCTGHGYISLLDDASYGPMVLERQQSSARTENQFPADDVIFLHTSVRCQDALLVTPYHVVGLQH
ncbi:hypothetical protein E2C01_067299 [Portunus trituberculatus]|uniref:Uncharacterized protein n=1 Tax=Portunus trituberculatus TaxID=210409 RepID=A0A5B7HS91_PORTR|nr:hypothetical protein [Portunus trituberculatus]